MPDHELELRLREVARALDSDAPVLDPAVLLAARRRRARPALVALAALTVLAGLAAAPTAVSAFRHLFGVDSVPELAWSRPTSRPRTSAVR